MPRASTYDGKYALKPASWGGADSFTFLAVLLGADGAVLDSRAADPMVGLGIGAAILLVLKNAAREVYRRLMDSADLALVDTRRTSCATLTGCAASDRYARAGSATPCAPKPT